MVPGASLSLSFLAPPRTGSLATAAAANPLTRRASGVGLGSLLQSNQGGGVIGVGSGGGQQPASDVFLPQEGSAVGYVPNGGVGASLGPAAVAAQAKAVAEARRWRQKRQW